MGKIKDKPRNAVVSFRTTEESKAMLEESRGKLSVSEFVDLLLTLYLQRPENLHSQGETNDHANTATASA